MTLILLFLLNIDMGKHEPTEAPLNKYSDDNKCCCSAVFLSSETCIYTQTSFITMSITNIITIDVLLTVCVEHSRFDMILN